MKVAYPAPVQHDKNWPTLDPYSHTIPIKAAYPTLSIIRPPRATEPTSNSTKTNQPTLRQPHHKTSPDRSLGSTKSNQLHLPPLQHGDAASQTSIDRILPSPTRLPCTARPETTSSKATKPLQVSSRTGEPIGEIEAKDGLPSADRNNKATLLLTGPFRTAKSAAKDLTPLVLKLQYAKYHDALRAPWKNRLLRR